MAYIDKQGYLRYTQEEEETMANVKSQFTAKGQKTDWADSIISKLLPKELRHD